MFDPNEPVQQLQLIKPTQADRMRLQKYQNGLSQAQEMVDNKMLTNEEGMALTTKIRGAMDPLQEQMQQTIALEKEAATKEMIEEGIRTSMVTSEAHRHVKETLPMKIATFPHPATGIPEQFYVPPDGSPPTPLFGGGSAGSWQEALVQGVAQGGQGAVQGQGAQPTIQPPNFQQFNSTLNSVIDSLTTTNPETGVETRPNANDPAVQEEVQRRMQMYQQLFPAPAPQTPQMTPYQQAQIALQTARLQQQGQPGNLPMQFAGVNAQGQGVTWHPQSGITSPQAAQTGQQFQQQGPSQTGHSAAQVSQFIAQQAQAAQTPSGQQPASGPMQLAEDQLPVWNPMTDDLPANYGRNPTQLASMNLSPPQDVAPHGQWSAQASSSINNLYKAAIANNNYHQAATLGWWSRMLAQYGSAESMPPQLRANFLLVAQRLAAGPAGMVPQQGAQAPQPAPTPQAPAAPHDLGSFGLGI